MTTNWDYSQLATAYLKRPDYAPTAIKAIVKIMGLNENSKCCDVGAGTAHLTLALANEGLNVVSIEPNDNMRNLGMERTKHLDKVNWLKATGEDTAQPDATYDAVTFGSSFNVMNRSAALREVARIAKPNGWFAALWNHRNLQDPIQAEIENIISSHIPDYTYGSRREDQTNVIVESGLFGEVIKLESFVTHQQKISEVVEAWRSHATLHRQSENKFSEIINDIENFLHNLDNEVISVPYTTRVWLAQLK